MIFGIIDGQGLRISTEKIVSDSFNYLTAKFFFSDDWAGTVKWAHFVQADEQYDIMLDADNEIKQDKHLTLQEGCWTVYLHGNRMDGDEVTERITTEQRGIKVLESGVVDGEPIPLPPSAAEQILAYAMEAREKIANLQADAETLEPGSEATATYDYESNTMNFGIPQGEKGEIGEPGPQGEAFTLEDFEQTATYQAIIASEEARETAENERELAEESRETAEQNRVTAEESRVTAEESRVTAEESRVTAEKSRVTAEESRVTAEESRVTAEESRVTAEESRVTAEESRVTAESERVTAEEERATEFAGFASQIASKADKTALADTDRNLKYLYELTHGQSWDLERGTNPAYQQTVPSGAHKADVLMYGGKTVVWNQLSMNNPFSSRSGITTSKDGAYSVLNGTATSFLTTSGWWQKTTDTENVIGHSMLMIFVIISGSYTGSFSFGSGESTLYLGNVGVGIITTGRKISGTNYYTFARITSGTIFNDLKILPIIVDLTKMFGAGNEPSALNDQRILDIIRYAELHPDYDEGSLMSANVTEIESKDASNNVIGSIAVPTAVKALPGYGWSAGDVYNYVDLEKRQFHKRVEAVDLGSLSWVKGTNTFYVDLAGNKKAKLYADILNVKYLKSSIYSGASMNDKTFYIGNSQDVPILYIKDSSYTDAAGFKAAMNGVMLYYELEEEIVTDISDLWAEPTYLGVEAGGTLTFKQSDDTQFAIPNDTEYYINLSEVTPNA